MRRMRELRLYGHLREQFGDSFRFMATCPAEAIRAAFKLVPGFRAAFNEVPHYVLAAGVDGDLQGLAGEELRLWTDAEIIEVVPVIEGTDFGISAAVAGALAAAGASAGVASFVGTLVSTLVIGMAVSAISYGISAALAPSPQRNEKGNRSLESYGFSGVEQTTDQGVPVPVWYGEMIVGGPVISFRIVSQNSV